MSSANTRILNLHRLDEGMPALTSLMGGILREACLICFESQGHESGVELNVLGTYGEVFTVTWDGEVTDQMRRTWEYEEFATEQAAYGIAVLLMEWLTGYTAVERIRKGPGFDYWLGYYDEASDVPIRRMARLEVSGIRVGNNRAIAARVAQKKKQIIPSNDEHPAYVVVVEFSRPLSWVVEK